MSDEGTQVSNNGSEPDFDIPAVMGVTKTGMLIKFFNKRVVNAYRSQVEGRPWEDVKPYIHIVAGKSEMMREVKEEDKIEHKDLWEAFQRGEQMAPSGTALESWPQMNQHLVLALKVKNILTVEQVAALSDADLDLLGMGGRELRAKAQAFLKCAADTALPQKLAAEILKKDHEIAALKAEIRNLSQRFEATMASGMTEPATRSVPVTGVAPAPTTSPEVQSLTEQVKTLTAVVQQLTVPKVSKPRGRPRKITKEMTGNENIA